MDTSFPIPPPAPEPRKHSPLGIAAFAIGILSGFGICLTLGLSFYAQTSAGYQTAQTLTSVVGFMAICTVVISLVGVGLGIAGVAQKAQSKVFGIIGLVLNVLVFLSLCAIMVLGFAVLSSL